MDKQESQRLQQEIKYWSSVISSHKRSDNFQNHTNKKSFATQRYAWNKYKGNECPEKNQVFRNGLPETVKVHPYDKFHTSKSISSASSFSGLSATSAKDVCNSFPSSNKKSYKWNKADGNIKQNPYTSAQSSSITSSPSLSKSHSLPLIPVVKDNSYKWKSSNNKTAVSLSNNKTFALPSTAAANSRVKPHPQATYTNRTCTSISQHHKSKLTSKSPEKNLRKLPKDDSRFKWNKSAKLNSTINSALSNNLSTAKKFCSPKVARSNSKYRYTKRRSSSLDRSIRVNSTSKSATDMRRKILAKYKLLLTRQIRSTNLSKNPYKVIKKETSSLPREKFARQHLHKKRMVNHSAQRYGSKKFHFTKGQKYRMKRTAYKSRLYENRSRFKFTRQRVATRSKTSGNIVLKRTQQSEKGLTMRAIMTRNTPTFMQRLASNALNRSLETVRSRNRLKLKKVYCIFYNRFGKCNRGEKCTYAHDPDRVAICPQFLRGTCRKESCPFSHKTSKQKMPVCSFFLRGSCSATNCSYLHVFLGKDAPVCKAFALTGFCIKAEECKHLHIRVCPEFYEKGKCEGKCKLPHRRKITRKKPTLEVANSTKGNGFISFSKANPAQSEVKNDDSKGEPTASVRIEPRLKVRKPQK